MRQERDFNKAEFIVRRHRMAEEMVRVVIQKKYGVTAMVSNIQTSEHRLPMGPEEWFVGVDFRLESSMASGEMHALCEMHCTSLLHRADERSWVPKATLLRLGTNMRDLTEDYRFRIGSTGIAYIE